MPRGVPGVRHDDDEIFCDSDSVDAVLSAFTSLYSGTTVGSLAIVAFVSSLSVQCFSLIIFIVYISPMYRSFCFCLSEQSVSRINRN